MKKVIDTIVRVIFFIFFYSNGNILFSTNRNNVNIKVMIIGISGKAQSGKDTIAKIIQYLTSVNIHIPYHEWIGSEYESVTNWEVIKFADKVKDIVCLILGCTREQLEDEKFKNSELGEEWIRYGYANGFSHVYKGAEDMQTIMINEPCSKERYEQECRVNWQTAYKSILTPRKLMQLIGTDMGRVIHPNIWINATMKEYYPIYMENGNQIMPITGYIKNTNIKEVFPNWVISDVRFPNELKAIEDRDGFVIRVNRPLHPGCAFSTNTEPQHESERALDNHTFKYTISNNGTIEELINNVKEILIKEQIL